jgi:predicted amidohydrolase YtcJ
MLRAGYLADLVVADCDLFALPPERLGGVQVQMTVVGGRIVYRR